MFQTPPLSTSQMPHQMTGTVTSATGPGCHKKILLTWKDSWKNMRPKIKEREKVIELARAVTEMGKSGMASVITEKHGENAELTADAFTGLTS